MSNAVNSGRAYRAQRDPLPFCKAVSHSLGHVHVGTNFFFFRLLTLAHMCGSYDSLARPKFSFFFFESPSVVQRAPLLVFVSYFFLFCLFIYVFISRARTPTICIVHTLSGICTFFFFFFFLVKSQQSVNSVNRTEPLIVISKIYFVATRVEVHECLVSVTYLLYPHFLFHDVIPFQRTYW